MTGGRWPNVQSDADDRRSGVRAGRRRASGHRILAEPPLHADPAEPDPFMEGQAGRVLGEHPREKGPEAGLPRTPGSELRGGCGRRPGRAPIRRRRCSPTRPRHRPRAPSSRREPSSRRRRQRRGPRDEAAFGRVRAIEMTPVGRLALERRDAGRDALGVDAPDSRPVGGRHRLDGDAARGSARSAAPAARVDRPLRRRAVGIDRDEGDDEVDDRADAAFGMIATTPAGHRTCRAADVRPPRREVVDPR